MKRLTILGATGSIGTNTLEIVSLFPDRFAVNALCASGSIERLAKQVKAFSPKLAVVIDEATADALAALLPTDITTEILFGEAGYRAAATMESTDMVVSAMVGAAGLAPTLAAIEAGKAIALANKEVLVMAGEIVMQRAVARNVPILPIDSEHSAVFQCLAGHGRQQVAAIYLTASGGPFLKKSSHAIENAGVADALAHPTWTMGRKISIDSATLMNKGLEIIEAHFLFQVPPDAIKVVIHPQSIVHSMVGFVDGSMLAQLGEPDMKGAIAYALSYPERLPLGQIPPDLAALGELRFEYPDVERFPCLGFAYAACQQGGTMPGVLNAANETVVEAFLEEEVSFGRIPAVIETVMGRHTPVTNPSLSDIKEADGWARKCAREIIGQAA
ncbi:MAG: 1-deoxy-D-xylulose-5-phosphate reductoisomerase [Thermodesulfobacteriota bacterium]|nr:1-deoxy-D-xylulose-5-phosphate reductoisomerase [Thermodesulfobacteriota bacterium]